MDVWPSTGRRVNRFVCQVAEVLGKLLEVDLAR